MKQPEIGAPEMDELVGGVAHSGRDREQRHDQPDTDRYSSGRQCRAHRAAEKVLPDQLPPGHATNTSPLLAFAQPRRAALAALERPHPAQTERFPLARRCSLTHNKVT